MWPGLREARWVWREADGLKGIWGRTDGERARGRVRNEASLGPWQVVSFIKTGNTEGQKALGRRKRREQ